MIVVFVLVFVLVVFIVIGAAIVFVVVVIVDVCFLLVIHMNKVVVMDASQVLILNLVAMIFTMVVIMFYNDSQIHTHINTDLKLCMRREVHA